MNPAITDYLSRVMTKCPKCYKKSPFCTWKTSTAKVRFRETDGSISTIAIGCYICPKCGAKI